jgi:hypothetical protein
MRKKISLLASLILLLAGPVQAEDDFGATLQIYTRLRSFIGKPSWLLVIRDEDHDQTIPYVFDIERGQNVWLAFTYGAHYQIVASTLQVSIYQPNGNNYIQYTINDFCHLESGSFVIQGESMYISLEGDLSPDARTYTCRVSRYKG